MSNWEFLQRFNFRGYEELYFAPHGRRGWLQEGRGGRRLHRSHDGADAGCLPVPPRPCRDRITSPALAFSSRPQLVNFLKIHLIYLNCYVFFHILCTILAFPVAGTGIGTAAGEEKKYESTSSSFIVRKLCQARMFFNNGFFISYIIAQSYD